MYIRVYFGIFFTCFGIMRRNIPKAKIQIPVCEVVPGGTKVAWVCVRRAAGGKLLISFSHRKRTLATNGTQRDTATELSRYQRDEARRYDLVDEDSLATNVHVSDQMQIMSLKITNDSPILYRPIVLKPC